MYLARVTGTVVASQKVEGLDGVKLLLVEPVDDEGRPSGAQQVAADAVQAGVGELVYVCTGREASMALDTPFVPVDLTVVGHVDDVNTKSGERAAKEAPAAPGAVERGVTAARELRTAAGTAAIKRRRR